MTKNSNDTINETIVQVHEHKPEGFLSQVEVAACYIEINGTFLFLQRPEIVADSTLASGLRVKSQPGAWGVPAGKIEANETPLQGACRELFEETGIAIEPETQMRSLGALYICRPEVSYIYHLFQIMLDSKPSVTLSHEHQAYVWVSMDQVRELNLIGGAYQALEHYRARVSGA